MFPSPKQNSTITYYSHKWSVYLLCPEIRSTVFFWPCSTSELWKASPPRWFGIPKMSTPFLELKCLCSAMMCHAQNSKFWLLEERLLFSTSKAQQQIVLHSTGQALVLSGCQWRWKHALLHFIELISLHAHTLYFFSHFFYTEKC